jgi:hypothetical protein
LDNVAPGKFVDGGSGTAEDLEEARRADALIEERCRRRLQ